MNKVAVITGSAKGLGKAIAISLAKKGFSIVIHYHKSKEQALETAQLIRNLSVEVMTFQADLSNSTEVENLFKKVEEHFHRLDVLVNVVGDYLKKHILELKPTEWDHMIQSNLNSCFYCIHYAIPLMQKNSYGRIINIGFASVGNMNAEPLITPYFIAKTGILLLTKSVAQSVAKDNINVHLLSPGVLENSVSQPIEDIPKKRVALFSEFIDTLEFLISDQADYLTGTHLEVAGGWRL